MLISLRSNLKNRLIGSLKTHKLYTKDDDHMIRDKVYESIFRRLETAQIYQFSKSFIYGF